MKGPSVGKARVLYPNITPLCDPMNCAHKTNNLKNIERAGSIQFTVSTFNFCYCQVFSLISFTVHVGPSVDLSVSPSVSQ